MVCIRELRQEDGFHDLIAHSRDFFHEYEAHHEDFFKIDHINNADIPDYFRCFPDSENAKAFVAEEDGAIVGYIMVHVHEQALYWKVKKVGDISGMMVHKAYRRQGIDCKLMAHAREFFAGHGVRYFALFTVVRNEGAIAFYERNGLIHLQTTMQGKYRRGIGKVRECMT